MVVVEGLGCYVFGWGSGGLDDREGLAVAGHGVSTPYTVVD